MGRLKKILDPLHLHLVASACDQISINIFAVIIKHLCCPRKSTSFVRCLYAQTLTLNSSSGRKSDTFWIEDAFFIITPMHRFWVQQTPLPFSGVPIRLYGFWSSEGWSSFGSRCHLSSSAHGKHKKYNNTHTRTVKKLNSGGYFKVMYLHVSPCVCVSLS